MAAEITASAPTGLVLTARLAQGATIGASITLTESGTLAGYYTGSVPGGTAAGRYAVTVLNGTVPIGAGELRWDGTAEILPSIAGDAMALTAGERTATRGVIEASTVLGKEATAAAIKAKTDALPAAPAAVGDIPSAASIAAAVWAAGSRTLTSFGTLVTDAVTAVWAAATRTLTADPGAAAHAATQTAVAAVPANVRVNLATELARLDVAVSTRESESSAASRAAADIAEHDATQTTLATLQTAATAASQHAAQLVEHDATQAALSTGTVRANIVQVNGTSVQGTGASDNKWRPVS